MRSARAIGTLACCGLAVALLSAPASAQLQAPVNRDGILDVFPSTRAALLVAANEPAGAPDNGADSATPGHDSSGTAGADAASRQPSQPAWLPPLPRRSPIFVPQWELGIGVSALTLPDYRGSDQSRTYAIPFPYATWRSERFTADRSGLKAELLDRGRLEIDLSLAASVPVTSRRDGARAGMPRLNPTIEFGPQLVATLWRNDTATRSLRMQFPLRYVMTVSRDMNDAGLTFNPRLVFDSQNVAGYHGWNLGVVAGPMFGSRRHHDFYYSVDSAYATETRPAYRASGGFGGYQLTLALSKRFTHHWLGAFVRADWLDGAVFEDSPLVRRRQNVAAGIAYSWILSQSDKRVPLAR